MNLRLVQATLAVLILGFASARAGVVVESFGVISSDPQENLFATIGPSTSPSLLADVGAVEEWPVTINMTRIQSLPGTVVLNLPEQTPETLNRLRSSTRGTSGFMWTGGSEGCSALLSAIPGAFRATISCLGGSYRVETTPSGVRLTRYTFDQATDGSEFDQFALIDQASQSSAGSFGPITTSCTPADPLSPDQVVDVMILYTADVRQALQAIGINPQQFMQDTLDSTQLAMDRSTTPDDPIIAELNLVHAEEVTRPDTGNYEDDLLYLAGGDVPRALRSTWGADIVMYIRNTTPQPTLCGKASSPQFQGSPPPGPAFAPIAVGVTKRTCGFSDYPFQHEFAHIFGANHDPDANENDTELQEWAHAHWYNYPIVKDRYSARTLVSTKHEDCYDDCPEVLNYSNADITVFKKFAFQTGVAGESENAKVIAEFTPITAQYCQGSDAIFADGFE